MNTIFFLNSICDDGSSRGFELIRVGRCLYEPSDCLRYHQMGSNEDAMAKSTVAIRRKQRHRFFSSLLLPHRTIYNFFYFFLRV